MKLTPTSGDETSQTRTNRLTTFAILLRLFAVLFAQMQLIIFASLISPKGVQFASKIRLQTDFEDFYIAAGDWLAKANPYLRLDAFQYQRFNKPAPILLLALPLHYFSEQTASYIFFAANILAILAAVWGICHYFKLNRIERLLLFCIASMYFPVIFVVERGNLDAFMLALIVLSLLFKNPLLKGIALGFSVGLKLYTTLLLAPLALARQWKQAVALLVTSAALFLCFPTLFLSFFRIQQARGGENSLVENISPAAFASIFTHIGESNAFKPAYVALWLVSYGALLIRYRRASSSLLTIYSLPWMAAFPFFVLPYTGVLLLPVMVLRVREMAARGRLMLHDHVFLAGFLLVGFQPYAMTASLAWMTHSHSLFYTFNPLGTALVIGSLAFGASAEEAPSDRGLAQTVTD
jgi:hypothetical protein